MGDYSWRRNRHQPMSATDAISPTTFFDRRMIRRHMAEEERFFRSKRGELLELFILHSVVLDQAPNAQKEELARKIIAYSADVAAAIQELDAMRIRQAAEAHLPYEPFGMPGNPAFDRLISICERGKHFGEAIDLCAAAKEQGWAGDWDRRIARCTAKQAGLRKHPRHPKTEPDPEASA